MGAESSDHDLKKRKILTIFLSYGHKDSAKVDLIKRGLKERGYKNIWIDVEKIEPGAVWRRDIVEGIRESDIFMAFLSKYSMRDPGVCRDEVQISVGLKGGNIKTVLLEPLEEILPPATIAHTQWLDISQWNGRKEELPQILDNICKMVESKDNYYLEDEVDLLRRIMDPADCEARIKELNSRQMFGREWLYEALTQWDNAGRSNIFWLSGGAGFGKSMFSANLCFKMPEKVVAAHFVEWNNTEKNNAGNILKSLAFQLARRYPDYRKFIMGLPEGTKHKLFMDDCEPDVLCDTLFCEKAGICIDGGHESAWALIDALDEATKDGVNPVARMIARYRDRFPKWLKFVITSRDDAAIRVALASMNPDVYAWDEKIRQYQRQDMLAYLKATLAECGFTEDVYDTLIEKSEGMFLYLRYACETILTEHLKEWQVKDLPQGITGIYESYFERHFSDENYEKYDTTVRPVLEIYCAAYEILPLDFFAEVMDCGTEAVRKSVAKLGTLKVDRQGKDGKATFQLCHKSVWDWLVNLPSGDRSFRVSREDGLKKLTDFCLKKVKEYKMEQITKDPNNEYPLRYVIRHLVETKNEEAIWELLGGQHPQLPKLQYDFFGSYAASVSSLKTAILFYMDLYNSGAGKKTLILPKIARLMVTCTELQLEQQKDLKKIFQSSSLQETLDFMEGIKDVKQYFCIGCYLLTKFKEKQDIDRLISAIEKKCGDQIDSIDWDDRDFLRHGVFPKVIEGMTAEQVIRLLRNIGDSSDAKSTMDSLKDQLNLPQAARAYWYFDKLQDAERGRLGDHAKLPEEKERIARIQDADDRCEELIKLATNLYVHDDLPEAQHLLDEAVELLEEADSQCRLEEAAELYWNMGKTAEAGRLILDNHKIYGSRSDRDFINDLCKFGLSEEAYGFFEKCILPDPEETADFLKKSVSPVIFLKGLAENGQSGKIREVWSEGIDLQASDLIALLETMIDSGAVNDAAKLLELFCAQEGNEDCLFKSPKLLSLMRQLKDAGAWRNDIPKEAELKENFLKNYSLETVRDYWRVFSPDFSPEFQLELIREGWQCFLESVKDPELSANDKAETARDMGNLLTQNSSELRDKLAPAVGAYLERIKELSDDAAFFNESCYYVEDWLNGADMLLNDTLDAAAVKEFAAWCSRKITEAMEGGNFDRDVERYCDALLQYYFTGYRCAEAEALLNILPKSVSEKVESVFDALKDVLIYWRRRSECENLPLPAIPEGFMTVVDMACGFCSPGNVKLGNIRYEVSRFFEDLKTYREQPMAVRIGRRVWQSLDELFRKTPFKDLDDAFVCLQKGSWCIPDEQFDRWLGKVKDYVNKEEGSRNHRNYADVLISRAGDSEQLPENWFGAILDGIAKVTDLSNKNELLVKLLAVVIRKGTPDQQQEILSRLTDRDLTGNCWELRELDLERLYRVLTGGNVSDAAICGVVKKMGWKKLPFEKLCLIAPHMVDEKEYTEKWFESLFRKLLDEKEIETMQQIASECPELGLSRFCDKREAPVAAAALTAEKVAGMVPKMSEALLALRKQLAEEELTPKGYAKRVGELLALLPEDTKQKIAELESALNGGDITEKGFARGLTELLG